MMKMNDLAKDNVCAIVVTYYPEQNLFIEVIASLRKQFSKIVIINNGGDIQIPMNPGIIIENLTHNYGIAYAHNLGIKIAKELRYKYACIFDQDSVIESEFISKLLDVYQQLEKEGFMVSAVGPRPLSRSTNKEYKGKFEVGEAFNSHITQTRQIISSGSLLSIHAFEKIGFFKESMFIDLVDYEWCWRGNQIGFRCFIAEDVPLQHMFGKREVRLLGFRVTAPTSFRIYFQFRNYLWLLPVGYVPLYWKISNGFKLIVKFFLFPVWFLDKEYIFKSIKGLRDGIFKKRGF